MTDRFSPRYFRRFRPMFVHWRDGYGYLHIALGRKRDISIGRFVIRGWGFHVNKRYDYRVTTEVMCERGCGARLWLCGWRDFTLSAWFYCPRCRYRVKRRWQLRAAFSAEAERLEMTDGEYEKYADAKARAMIVPTDQIPPDDLERARKLAEDHGW